ncbi:MAG: hypothetical protein ACKVVP_20065 [Chloroflexota bacterium]
MQPAMRAAFVSILLSLGIVSPGAALAAPGDLQAQCPLISTEAVSTIVGTSVQTQDYLIVSSSGREECVFMGGTTVALGRVGGFFGTSGPEAFQPEVLLQLTSTRDELVFSPESGVGDMASWAQVADPALRAERFSVLIVRRGTDAFFFSLDDSMTDNALEVTKALARAVLDQTP